VVSCDGNAWSLTWQYAIAVAEPETLVKLTKQGVEVMDAKDIPAPPSAADKSGSNSAAANTGAQG